MLTVYVVLLGCCLGTLRNIGASCARQSGSSRVQRNQPAHHDPLRKVLRKSGRGEGAGLVTCQLHMRKNETIKGYCVMGELPYSSIRSTK